jgi:hypothetical protein
MNAAISPASGLSGRAMAHLFRLTDRALSGWMRLANSRIAAFVFFGAVYIWPTVMLAQHKLLWADEFFTFYISKTRTWNDLIAALTTGADQHPPSFYYLTHLICKLAGTTHVIFRLPAIIGFGAACLCLYEIVSRLLTRPWGMAAMFLPLTMKLYYYASEGRGYGLELGFVSFSVLMWMLACEGRRRALTVPLLAAGLCGAVASHYYAVLALIPLIAGELVRTRVRGKLDLPVWLAFGGALIPVVGFAHTILSANSYSTHFWAQFPHVYLAAEWYVTTLGYPTLVPIGAFALVILFRAAEGPWPSATGKRLCSWYSAAILLLAFLPVFGIALARLVTHAYTERYMIAAGVGVSILLILLARRAIGNDRLGPAFVCAVCLPFFFWQVRGLNKQEFSDLQAARSSAAFLRGTGDAPVAMAEVFRFHRLSFYARRDLVRRLAYVADPHLSIRYLGHDTIDRGLLALNPWFPLNVVWWHDWLRAHPSFLMYGWVDNWTTWLAFELPSVGNVQFMKREELSVLLFSVQNAKSPASDRTSSDPSGEPMLYRKLAGLESPVSDLYDEWLPGSGRGWGERWRGTIGWVRR